MKKKILTRILCVMFTIIFICGLFILLNTNFYKVHKANSIFGMDFCDKDEVNHPTIGLTVISQYKCEICSKRVQHGSSPTPIICKDCSEITNRCQWCGKLER